MPECIKCKTRDPKEFFRGENLRYSEICKVCALEELKRYLPKAPRSKVTTAQRQLHAEKNEFFCNGCELWLPREFFPKKNNRWGVNYTCYKCLRRK